MVGLVLGIIAAAFLATWALLRRRMRRALGGRLIRTGAARRTHRPGPILVEGAVASRAVLRAPCSGKPCLYWEVDVGCEWDEPIPDKPGHWRAGQQHYGTRRQGVPLLLDDGSGPLEVDLGIVPKADLVHSFEQLVSVRTEKIPRELQFGALILPTPPMALQDRTRAYRAVERILPANNKLLVRGSPVDGVLRQVDLISTVLRRARLGQAPVAARWALGGAFAAALAAIPLMLVGPWALGNHGWEAEPLPASRTAALPPARATPKPTPAPSSPLLPQPKPNKATTLAKSSAPAKGQAPPPPEK